MTLRTLLLTAVLLVGPAGAHAINFTLLEVPALAGFYPGPDQFFSTPDDLVLPGFNPNGSLTTYQFNNPQLFIGGPEPALIGYSSGGFSTAGNQLYLGANSMNAYNVTGTTASYSDFANGVTVPTFPPTSNTLGANGINTMTLSANNLLFSQYNFLSDGINEFVATGLIGTYMLAGQNPTDVFTGVFGDPLLDQLAIDIWNSILPLLPAGWTFAGAELLSFTLPSVGNVLDGSTAGLFYSTDAGAARVLQRVPEPATALLAVAGLAALGRRRVRRA